MQKNTLVAGWILSALVVALPASGNDLFRKEVASVFEHHCLQCHNDGEKKGGLSLETVESLRRGGESGAVVEPDDPDASLLLEFITGDEPEMPKDGKPLSADQVATIRNWIADGAKWPAGLTLKDNHVADLDWWSLRPIIRSVLPKLSSADATRVRTPIDVFILSKLREVGLQPSPLADRRTLVRRLYFDLIGLPPTPAEIDAFVTDPDSRAYEHLVDRLLASPRYGERWARHWLDVVHYGDTHGYDKDKLRPNGWPYRDYVIRAFNSDKPYGRFIQEQIAGDALWPDTRDGIEATGFLAAGPWDFIGHAEVPETKIDGKVARHVDRDDMVRTVFETFNSLTVGCAQCHNHKFDPVTMEDYYSLHAVFASIDRADREYDVDPQGIKRRQELTTKKQQLETATATLQRKIQTLAGDELALLDKRLAELNKSKSAAAKPRPEFGYHSQIEKRPDVTKWVQVDLGKPTELAHIVIVGCHDDFNGIGAGFGFPVRFRIEISNDREFKNGVTSVVDRSGGDVQNPKVVPQSYPVANRSGRFIRVTATKLTKRLATDYIFALAELQALTPAGKNAAHGKKVTSLDSIQAPVRWRRSNLVDGYFHGVWNQHDLSEIVKLGQQREAILKRVMTAKMKAEQAKLESALAHTTTELNRLPKKVKVFVGCVYHGKGNFRGRGGLGPREIRVLHRGQVTQPGAIALPGTVPIIEGAFSRFKLAKDHRESARRIALARWLTRRDHPLTWRSIVNRVWQYHFGRGIVATPGDFGRMGQKPTHPELLDWLAAEFRDGGQSIKQLHRLIVISSTYRQVSQPQHPKPETRPSKAESIDAENRFLWRMNRRRLEAEAIRDSVLFVAGKLDMRMYGPGFRDFVLERPEHSPHYEYHKHDPNDPATHRRSVYRFLVRSQPQPFMDALDCADPSQMVARRNETQTALQALALLNNKFMVRMSEQFASRSKTFGDNLSTQIEWSFRSAIGRPITPDEQLLMQTYAKQHGLDNACRVILNLNEFSFVD